jgi:putative addiction module killer protein
MTVRVEEYVREDGSSPFRVWFDVLDPAAAAKVATALLRLRQSNTSNVKWFGGLGECVIDWGLGYRVYLTRDGESLIVLLGGGTKRMQQADIDRAKTLLEEYKARKALAKGQAPDASARRKRRRKRR